MDYEPFQKIEFAFDGAYKIRGQLSCVRRKTKGVDAHVWCWSIFDAMPRLLLRATGKFDDSPEFRQMLKDLCVARYGGGG